VPAERNIIGDTLLFTYTLGFSRGIICDLGGLPNVSITVEALKN